MASESADQLVHPVGAGLLETLSSARAPAIVAEKVEEASGDIYRRMRRLLSVTEPSLCIEVSVIGRRWYLPRELLPGDIR